MADGVSFAGNGSKDVSNISYETSPSARPSGSGPIDFVGNGNQDCSGVIDTNNSNDRVPGSNEIKFVAE